MAECRPKYYSFQSQLKQEFTWLRVCHNQEYRLCCSELIELTEVLYLSATMCAVIGQFSATVRPAKIS